MHERDGLAQGINDDPAILTGGQVRLDRLADTGLYLSIQVGRERSQQPATFISFHLVCPRQAPPVPQSNAKGAREATAGRGATSS